MAESAVNGAIAMAVLVTITVLEASGLARLRHADPALQAASFTRAQALAAASVDAARREHALWLDTEALLKRATRRAAEGEFATALRLARRAHREASLARNQARLEAARYGLSLGRDALAESAVASLEHALHAHDGRRAYALAQRYGLLGAD